MGNVILKNPDKDDLTSNEKYLEESIRLLPTYAATKWYYEKDKKEDFSKIIKKSLS